MSCGARFYEYVYQEPSMSKLPRFCQSVDQEPVELFCQNFLSRMTTNQDEMVLR